MTSVLSRPSKTLEADSVCAAYNLHDLLLKTCKGVVDLAPALLARIGALPDVLDFCSWRASASYGLARHH